MIHNQKQKAMKFTNYNLEKMAKDLEHMSLIYGIPMTLDVTDILTYRLNKSEIYDEECVLIEQNNLFYFTLKLHVYYKSGICDDGNSYTEISDLDIMSCKIESMIGNVSFTFNENTILNSLL